jgi:outer membrane receptor for ferrienterochelin and colicin
MSMKIYQVLLLLTLSIGNTAAQDLDSLLNMSAFTEESELQKELNKATKVASGKALSTRETPGILSVVSAEEIENSGARDLTDVLRLVPGFDIGQDVQFVQGISFRGNWANEGKILVMVDGQPFNELLYQTTAIGNRFPIGLIERIEIIRGPGSAVYGGSAEYGVINIITKAANSLDGVIVTGTAGLHPNAVGRTNAGIAIARKNGDFKWDASFYKGAGIITDQPYQDLYQEEGIQNTVNTTSINPQNINVGFSYKRTSLRTMYDEFKTGDPFTFVSYENFYVQMKHEAKLSSKITVTPELRYYNQIPWAYGDRVSGEYSLRVRVERLYAGATFAYDPSKKININAGVLYFEDKANDLLGSARYSGENTLQLYNYALFAQGLVKLRLANITLGMRYERNNRFGDAFVPRLALTKKIENFHFKILYSEAFRAPAIENINTAQGGRIKPEKSHVFEAELGYQFTPEMLFSVNIFTVNTDDVIIYVPVPNGTNQPDDSYKNYDRSGTRGIELQYSIRRNKNYINASYSYSVANSNTVDKYVVPQTSSQFIGQLKGKLTLNASFAITNNFTVNPSIILGGKRYAYNSFVNGVDSNGNSTKEPVVNEISPYTLANLFFNYRDLGIKGLTLGAGVYDLFDQRPVIPQAYNGDYAPIPTRSREYVLRASYQLDFKK